MAASKQERRPVEDAILNGFASELAEWRLAGCAGYGFHAEIAARIRKVAVRHGQSYSELWAEIHRRAYTLIDADPRSRLLGQK